ncbi:hypothetical protein [Marinomonas primoryensis]|uniref:hypothetical protein n=1 Tax=Marinomonas primoryensis TaxID=178399 RepID=UPI001EF9B463|nr:hypothetical protein [Marinomonas primoryensis]
MKKYTYLFSVTAALLLLSLSSSAHAEGIDAVVNEIFGNATGWFVSLIFAPFLERAFHGLSYG